MRSPLMHSTSIAALICTSASELATWILGMFAIAMLQLFVSNEVSSTVVTCEGLAAVRTLRN